MQRLRAFRNVRNPDLAVSVPLDAILRECRKRVRAVGGLDEVWSSLLPGSLANQCSVHSLTPAGILTIRTPDAVAKYEVATWLRTGGEAALRAACSRPLRRVKIL